MKNTSRCSQWHLEGLAALRSQRQRLLRAKEMESWAGVLEPGTRIIPLLHGKFALVDEDMYEELNSFLWTCNTQGYAYHTRPDRRHISMARMVLNPPDGMEVDHINRNPLDNRIRNLRVATRHQNLGNISKYPNKTSRFKGVSRRPSDGKWLVYAKDNGKSKFRGVFEKEEDAARCYNEWAKQTFGEFAVLNPV